jgi:hypothetical protein
VLVPTSSVLPSASFRFFLFLLALGWRLSLNRARCAAIFECKSDVCVSESSKVSRVRKVSGVVRSVGFVV